MIDEPRLLRRDWTLKSGKPDDKDGSLTIEYMTMPNDGHATRKDCASQTSLPLGKSLARGLESDVLREFHWKIKWKTFHNPLAFEQGMWYNMCVARFNVKQRNMWFFEKRFDWKETMTERLFRVSMRNIMRESTLGGNSYENRIIWIEIQLIKNLNLKNLIKIINRLA